MSPLTEPTKLVLRKGSSAWAEGGDLVYTIVVSGTTYRVHEFRTVGNSNLVVMNGGSFEYLIVGGGGGAGYAGTSPETGFARGAGGGGGGGVLYSNSPLFLTPSTYPLTVGAGGSGGISYGVRGSSGNSSLAFSLEAFGGGGGASPTTVSPSSGLNGASGGGGGDPAGAPVSGQGNHGGLGAWAGGLGTSAGGGGGGFSSAGANADFGAPGRGGDGYFTSITGSPFYVAGGGGGFLGAASSAPAGLGGGLDSFGGGGQTKPTVGERGGNGIIIIRYAI